MVIRAWFLLFNDTFVCPDVARLPPTHLNEVDCCSTPTICIPMWLCVGAKVRMQQILHRHLSNEGLLRLGKSYGNGFG